MKIGLALSGGGILGVAHIGALEQIEKNKIKVDMIAGVSSGAIAGALFAVGGVSKIDTFLYELKINGMFEPKNAILSLSPDKLFQKIRTFLGYYLPEKIEDLPVKFITIATDFATGENVVIDKGNLIDAIMASAAFPGLFSSQEINGKSLIDGGLTRNLPGAILREKGADFVIGSSLHKLEKLPKYHTSGKNPSRLQTAIRAIDILQKELTLYEVKECDFCFIPPIENYPKYRIDKVDEIRRIGSEYAEERMDGLLKIIKMNKPA
jgi:NTE family protein